MSTSLRATLSLKWGQIGIASKPIYSVERWFCNTEVRTFVTPRVLYHSQSDSHFITGIYTNCISASHHSLPHVCMSIWSSKSTGELQKKRCVMDSFEIHWVSPLHAVRHFDCVITCANHSCEGLAHAPFIQGNDCAIHLQSLDILTWHVRDRASPWRSHTSASWRNVCNVHYGRVSRRTYNSCFKTLIGKGVAKHASMLTWFDMVLIV